MRWAVYISSRRDFSQRESRKAAAHEIRSWTEGGEKRSRFAPAVLRAITLVYLRGGDVAVPDCVTEPRTWMNCGRGSQSRVDETHEKSDARRL